MIDLEKMLAQLEFVQIGWVVPDLEKAVKLLTSLGVTGFPEPEHCSAAQFSMTYNGSVTSAHWLTTQTFNNGTFVELIQPLSGKSMFQDYLQDHPQGGVQHLAYRLPVAGFDEMTSQLAKNGYALLGQVDHPIARMAFFDTYETLGVATEIMGITDQGWTAIRQMERR